MPDRALPVLPVLYTAPEAAQILGVSVETVRRAQRRGLIGCYLGNSSVYPRARFSRAQIESYRASLIRRATT